MTAFTWNQVLRFRAARHFLNRPASTGEKGVAATVSALGGIQAQVMSAGELQLWARLDDLKAGEVDAMLWQNRSLVKTWAMRGTLHLLTAEDLPVYVAAMQSTRNMYRKQYWLKAFGTDLEEIEAIIAAVYTVLDGKTLSREELAEDIVKVAKVPHQRDRLRSGWGEFLKLASYHGYLCFGPSQGQNVTFVRPDQWIAGWREVDPDEAMRTIGRRYFAAYGPSPRDEFSHWWGIQGAEGRHWLKVLEDELVEVDVEGWKGWLLRADVDAVQSASEDSSVRLLPNFDTFTLTAYHERNLLLAEDLLPRIYRKAGWISPVIVVDGRIQGVWKYEQKRKQIQVSIEPFTEFSASVKEGVEVEAARLGGFLGAPVEISFKAVG
ncbi:MAG: winged helix DNA-binding domain-containing protein [Chloroflexota bacterium]